MLNRLRQGEVQAKMVDAETKLKCGTVFNGDETILVVDDIESVRLFLSDALAMFGYSVICAEDGMDGLGKFRENKDNINIILLDVVMPKLNGIELFREISKINPDVKVLFMSGEMAVFAGYKLQEKIKCISKPFEIMTLLRDLREVLDS